MNNHELSREQFLVLNNLYNVSVGRTQTFSDKYLNKALERPDIFDELVELGYADEKFGMITHAGISALEPYKVSGAVILAAGPSTRFIPLSLEQPKGLYEVKGERLIDRQIKQLKEAGIEDIYVILGYKKESFHYLEELYGVTLLENPLYNVRNNIESLYVAKDFLRNSYVCVCDEYFVENPFNTYEYETFYAGTHVFDKTDEMYVNFDDKRYICEMVKGLDDGYVLLGHSFWNEKFADKFIELVQADRTEGKYSNAFWEWLVKDNIDSLPGMYFKQYIKGAVVEFDYFDQLRRFDSAYVKNTQSKIIENITKVFNCSESDIYDFRSISEGLTNTSFIFRIGETDYIYRHPGDGTENIISRKNEKSSLEIAKKWQIDPTYVYMDVKEGWKVSKFISQFREPDYNDFKDSKKVLNVLKKLHKLPIAVDYGLNPWEDAMEIEKLLKKTAPERLEGIDTLREKVRTLYYATMGDDIEKCFCHGDTYKPNWMIRESGEVILIDWEYSGYSDPGIDVGYYIVDAMYDFDTAKRFIREYLGDDYSKEHEFHFLAYTSLIAYYWYVWALYRESCGANMGDALENWHAMSQKYADYLIGDKL